MTRRAILLVHRDDHIYDAIQRSLENEHCDVLSSATVCDACGLLMRERFDGLVIELQMLVVEVNNSRLFAIATDHFQSKARIVGLTDSLTAQQAEIAARLQAEVVMSSSNTREVAQVMSILHVETTSRQCGLRDWAAVGGGLA